MRGTIAPGGLRLDPEPLHRRDDDAAGGHRRRDVGEEVLHHLARVALLQADRDRVLVALGARAAEREQALPEPALEERLLDGVELPRLAELDDDLLAEPLVAALLVDDLADH